VTLAIEIGHEEDDGKGAFFFEQGGVRLGEMTYSRTGPALVIIDHTEVHEKLKGLGVGRRMLDTAVAWARKTGTRIAATCPYARAQFEKDASIQDVYER
jgi:predicted GNAT family acetyltransferase